MLFMKTVGANFLAEHLIVLDTSAGFFSVRELKKQLENFKFCNGSVCIGKLLRKFCRQVTYIVLRGIVVCFKCHIMPSDD